MSPPNRLKCLYCGAVLDIEPGRAASIKHFLRQLEDWEKGFNVVAQGPFDEGQISNVAELLKLESNLVSKLLQSGHRVPLSRVETEVEASAIVLGLEEHGVKCSLVSDETLGIERPPVRLASVVIEPTRMGLVTFGSGETHWHQVDDFRLLVSGTITTCRSDTLEKKRRGERKIVDAANTVTDEPVLDIYVRGDNVGFRINVAGFDFSVLGADKSLVAGENLKKLRSVIETACPDIRCNDDFDAIRPALSAVWPPQSTESSMGLQYAGFGKRQLSRAAVTTNLSQFTRYSRLQAQL